MNINKIYNDLHKYKKEEFNTIYLQKTIKYFKEKNDKLNIINEISDNKYELSGIRIHLLYNNYKYIIADKILTNFSYKKINLTQKQYNNLLNQNDGIKNNNFQICNKIDKIINEEMYLIIIHDIYNIDLEYQFIDLELVLVLLGIESLNFLNHQNLDNYCSDIILNNSIDLFNNLKKFKNILNKISWLERDRILVFGGLIYHFLGTLHTKDIDITIFCKNNDQKNTYIEYFKDTNLDIFYFIKGDIPKTSLYYWYNWLFYKLPELMNVDSIYTFLINPKYHFYFMGIKCIDIFTNFQSFTNRRSNAVSINDTILLKKINNIDYYNIFCIKNFTLRSEKSRVFTEDIINRMYYNVINIMKKWWNIDISIEYLRNHFKKCITLNENINLKNFKYCNNYIKKILKYNKIFIELIISKYIKKK